VTIIHTLYISLEHAIKALSTCCVFTRLLVTASNGGRCRGIVQAVSHRLPRAAARVRSYVRSCGVCGGQSGAGAGFLRVFRFPLPILIPPTAPHSSSITRGWYSRPVVAAVPSGLSLTPLKIIKK
jgi:hypothetical protein